MWRIVVDTGDRKVRKFKELGVEVIDKKYLEYEIMLADEGTVDDGSGGKEKGVQTWGEFQMCTVIPPSLTKASRKRDGYLDQVDHETLSQNLDSTQETDSVQSDRPSLLKSCSKRYLQALGSKMKASNGDITQAVSLLTDERVKEPSQDTVATEPSEVEGSAVNKEVLANFLNMRVYEYILLSFLQEKRNIMFMQELQYLFALMMGSNRKFVDPSAALDLLKGAFRSPEEQQVREARYPRAFPQTLEFGTMPCYCDGAGASFRLWNKL
ncbi:hypothetical protein CB1_000569004 [Camelus ferus]|nr:hypothetical protein CB1_000569004 [Camelus ferus]